MEHELKIVLQYNDDKPINSVGTKVFVDGIQIGFIQDIKFEASAKDLSANLEITLPDLTEWNGYELSKNIDKIAETFGKISGAKVKFDKG